MSQNLHTQKTIPDKTKISCKTNNEYMLPVHFSTAKLARCLFANKDYLNVFTFLKINPHLVHFTHKVDIKVTRTVSPKSLHDRWLWCLWHLECLGISFHGQVLYPVTILTTCIAVYRLCYLGLVVMVVQLSALVSRDKYDCCNTDSIMVRSV